MALVKGNSDSWFAGERITDELPRLEERGRASECICGFTPDGNCPVDHMGRRKPDTKCICPPGELHGNCPEH